MRNPAYYLTALALTITPLIAMEQQDNQGNSNQNTGWDNLPDELKIGIIGHTSPSDAANAGLVNKKWHDLANDDVAWKHRFQNDFQEYQEEPREGESSKDVYKELKWSMTG
ncbi:F-box protein [Candidatus Paracaedibacter symbiosus]|uniref:F-box protein n=1 Tax=Candidatus Paracaedibacter symbiosus TaxID=244582 RepID=UPI000509D600|nr:F-box protein [Candidatus Paracaedibacter symbiosus]